MSALTGTGTLVRHVLRLDRVRLPVWIAAIAGLVLVSAASIGELYPTRADQEEYVALVGDNPAVVATSGPGYGFDDPNLGVVLANETTMPAAIFLALMSIFLLNRHTRAEEESERAELLRSTVVGRHAPAAAALVVVAGASVAVGAVLAGALLALGYPAAGTVAYATSLTLGGWVFAGVTLVAAQALSHGRAVLGTSVGVLGAAFALRAAGDIGDGTLSWLSPIGWVQAVRPWADERWWVLGLLAAAAVALMAVAAALAARRDLGAGLLPQRPGPARAARWSTTTLGLAVRLQRGAVVGWAVGLALLGLVYGAVGRDVERMVEDNPEIADIVAQAGGGSLTDAFLATALTIVAVIGAGFAIAAALRLRSEESAGRVEPLLATPTSRWRWAASHLAVALVGTVVVIAASGLGTGVGYALAVDDAGQVGRLTAASLANVPAVWVLVGVAVALVGLAPRFSGAAWGALAAVVVVAFFGTLVQLPDWAFDVSPFEHVPSVPAAELEVLPLVALTAVAAALVLAGLVGLRRRDLNA